ncbi:mercury resistance system periplasmic binding protein MerP [Candidatus Nitrosacidococcus sp. I8]|uniref:mercury resistance system periplasmic binding protein MerP n=1 Tax=Candidatus Nitrosacidococcus sp. I8 TaxID=2942908 RepID=UPI002225B9D5|nr:mercury resistance system periplasmic binding protein MerP [Candidatus Nitrosacidococcus sp. I8]CAH9018020.1 Mercuric transport protein periplasmic component [Candidatus Nitrosacidococcus sp. I8]
MKKLLVFFSLAVFTTPVLAITRIITLSVSNMTCAACPITIKKALSRVDGVSKIDIAFDKHEAVVTYDDAKVDVQKLTETTKNSGYPSSVKQ